MAAAGLPALLNGVPAEPAAERLCRTGNGVNLLAQLGKGGRRGAEEDGHLKVEKVPQKGLTEDVEDVGGGEVGQQAPLLHLVVEDGPLEERRLAGAVHGDQRRGNGAAAAENARAAQSGDVAAATTTSTEDNAHRAGAGQAGRAGHRDHRATGAKGAAADLAHGRKSTAGGGVGGAGRAKLSSCGGVANAHGERLLHVHHRDGDDADAAHAEGAQGDAHPLLPVLDLRDVVAVGVHVAGAVHQVALGNAKRKGKEDES